MSEQSAFDPQATHCPVAPLHREASALLLQSALPLELTH
jgi:hypothetical protein